MSLNFKEKTVNEVTEHYVLPIRLLHWLMAIMIISMLAMGLWMKTLPRQNNVVTPLMKISAQQEKNAAPEKRESLRSWAYGWHKRMGVFVLGLLILRLVIRVSSTDPKKISLPSWQKFLSKWTHALIYGLMLALPLSGWLMSTYAGYPPSILSKKIPLPFAPSNIGRDIHHVAHSYLAYILIGLLVLHTFAAFWHFLKKDGIFSRISF